MKFSVLTTPVSIFKLGRRKNSWHDRISFIDYYPFLLSRTMPVKNQNLIFQRYLWKLIVGANILWSAQGRFALITFDYYNQLLFICLTLDNSNTLDINTKYTIHFFMILFEPILKCKLCKLRDRHENKTYCPTHSKTTHNNNLKLLMQ